MRPWMSKELIGFSLTSFFNDFSHEMVTSILPLFIIHIFGSTRAPLFLGLITGFANMASTIGSLSARWLSKIIPYKKTILIFGYGITPLFSSLIGTTHHLIVIIIYRIIAWSAKGIREPIRDVWLVNILQPKDYGKAFGTQRAMDTFGAILGPLCAYYTLSYMNITTIFILALIPGIFSVIALMIFVKETVYEKHFLLKSTLVSDITLFPNSFTYYLAIRLLFGLAFFDPILIILKAQKTLIFTHATSVLSTGIGILLYTLFNCTRLISEVSIGFFSDTNIISKKNLLAITGFGAFALLNAFLIIASPTLINFIIILMLTGLSVASITVLEKGYTAHLLPNTMLSDGYGYLLASTSIGYLFSSIIIGILWTYISPASAFIYATCISFLCMFLLLIKKN